MVEKGTGEQVKVFKRPWFRARQLPTSINPRFDRRESLKVPVMLSWPQLMVGNFGFIFIISTTVQNI